ncbi:hypothetical protein FFW73_25985 [Escherichia coli]|uniref:hypothetical protein n=1 Tax=Escherichia coli TaxID=562 RepID=UPI000B7E2C22|nr:hypothetical protein [Escherichia coli]EFC4784129.1 hypothetical protein [Escherichia coli]EFD0482124.1 hypothetical protein [Escherichia coli]EIV7777886.1 hypothetical protein [Escherichia coli]EJK2775708.1 hypothetical protein [Escherichia coli]
MKWKNGHSPDDMKKFVNKNPPKIGKDFKKELSNRMRNVTQQIQQKINQEVEGGVIPYTGRAMYFNFKRLNEFESVNQIIVLGNQARYLKHIIDPDYVGNKEYKAIPYQNAKKTKQGNITQLKSKRKNDKYKKVKSKTSGKTYLIDTTKKTKTSKERVIGYYGSVGRKPIFDFYDTTEKMVLRQLQTMRGTFEYKWRK